MRRKQPRELQRSTRFETFEERLALSAQPVGDFLLEQHAGQRLEHHYGDLAPAESVAPVGDFNLSNGLASPVENAAQRVQTQLSEAHELTGVNEAYNTYGFDGAGQTVAIIDSGIAYDHVALGGGFGTSYRVVGGWDFAENDANPYDDGPAGFHGTHVGGIVGSDDATHRGVASGADLVALRVFDDNGAGYFSWVEDALKWVHDNRNAFENPITTVNLSLGTNWNADSIPDWAMLEEEFAQLEQDGIFIAVSAGNSFEDYNVPGLSYPAASSHVVPVASVDDTGLLSYFSQRNDRVLAAPGRSITSTVPDYIFGADGNPNDFGTASGTSMAAPYTAGASVLVRQAMEFVGIQNITQDTIYDHMRATADVVYDPATGVSYHRINVQAALGALIPGDSETGGSTGGDSAGGESSETLVGATFVNDAIRGRVVSLSGAIDHVEVDPTMDLNAEWTITSWFKDLAPGGWRTLTRGQHNDHQIIVDANGQLGSYDNAGGNVFHDSGFNMNSLSAGWHHIAAVGSGGTTTFYVDGVQVGTQIDVQSTSDVFSLGNYQGGGQRFADALDDTRVFDRVLSVGQIADMAVSGLRLGHWEFSETDGTAAADSAGGDNNGALVGATLVNDALRGRVLSLSGAMDHVEVVPTDLNTEWTITSWFKDLAPGTWRTLTRGKLHDHQIIVDANGQLGSYDNVGGNVFHDSGFNMNSLSAGWHHIAAVGSGGTTTFYVDGVQVGTINVQSTTDVFSLGNYQGGGQRFADALDDTRVFDQALSLGQIADMAVSGLRLGHWEFSETDGTAAADSAGGDNNGALVGATLVNDALRGRVLSLSGAMDHVEVVPTDLNTEWTITSWFKDLAPGTWRTLTRGKLHDHQIIVDANGQLGSYDNVGGNVFHDSGFNMNSLSAGWHHIAAVGSGGTTTFYVDGVQVGTINVQSTTDVFSLGNYQGGGQRFADALDDTRVFDQALSLGQIAVLATDSGTDSLTANETRVVGPRRPASEPPASDPIGPRRPASELPSTQPPFGSLTQSWIVDGKDNSPVSRASQEFAAGDDDLRLGAVDSEFSGLARMRAASDAISGARRPDDDSDVELTLDPDPSWEFSALDQVFSRMERLLD